MPTHSEFLSGLDKQSRADLERRLIDRQSGTCFICGEPIDLVLHYGQLDIDHIIPLAHQGGDEENNFALTHATCNRSKGAADLRVARRIKEFEKLQISALKEGARGANLGHLLRRYEGARWALRIIRKDTHVEYVLPEAGEHEIHRLPLYKDSLSEMQYFFTMLPIGYLHYDDRINPRSIGSNLRALIEEFLKKRPQLHVSLAWWASDPERDGLGLVKVFDGQHKAAAQILLGVTTLPVRVFLEPDVNVLLTANTNAGDKLRQVAFDVAILRHLGNTLYTERIRQYKEMKNLREDDYSFSEKDLVTFFKGEYIEMQRYIVDAVRDSITYNKDNRLMEFVEMSGKSANRPLAYSAIERTFFKEFIYKKALDIPIDERMEQGENPRILEREQLVRLMTIFASIFFIGHWDPEIGGQKLESRLQKGDKIPENHLRAWRIAREEILGNVLVWARLVIENYNAWMGRPIDRERLLQRRLPEDLWKRIEIFLQNLSYLPCWIDKNLSITVFGVKQNLDFWKTIFERGTAPNGIRVLTKPLELSEMIQEKITTGGKA
jgi:hypothetical protein